MTTQPYPRPSVGRLPDYRTTASYPFAITGVDFVGPSFIKMDYDQQDNKAYIVIFSCGTSRESEVRKSEELHEYLAEHEIQWEFVHTKSPWRGAFYERLNRDLKKMLYQKLGKSYLTFSGFSRVVKDINIGFNNHSIQYVEDELGPRVLTPNRIIHRRDVYL